MGDLNKFLKGKKGKLEIKDTNINLVRVSGDNKIVITLTLDGTQYEYIDKFEVDITTDDFVSVIGDNLSPSGANHDFKITYNPIMKTLEISSKMVLDENKIKDKHGA